MGPVGETRVDLLHLLEDLRDAYPGAAEETILTEIVANAIDSGAAGLTFTADPAQGALTIVDCLTLWVANRLLRGDRDDAILDEANALARLIGRRRSSFTVVSNEVGEGVHPETAAGLRFRDLLGGVNQRVAAACDTVVLMVAGIPLTIKTPRAGS